jgi:hypothetical protein
MHNNEITCSCFFQIKKKKKTKGNIAYLLLCQLNMNGAYIFFIRNECRKQLLINIISIIIYVKFNLSAIYQQLVA